MCKTGRDRTKIKRQRGRNSKMCSQRKRVRVKMWQKRETDEA